MLPGYTKGNITDPRREGMIGSRPPICVSHHIVVEEKKETSGDSQENLTSISSGWMTSSAMISTCISSRRLPHIIFGELHVLPS